MLTYFISPLLPVRSHTYLELSLAATEYQFVLNILVPH